MDKETYKNGLSLIELIVALAIVAILVLITVPSYLYYLHTNRLIGASNHLFFALQKARSDAIQTNGTVYVTFQAGTNWCYGINANVACNCAIAGNCTLGTDSYAHYKNVTLATAGLTANSLAFESDHGASDSSSVLTFSVTGGYSMSVKVGLLGNIQICSNQISGYQSC